MEMKFINVSKVFSYIYIIDNLFTVIHDLFSFGCRNAEASKQLTDWNLGV